MPLKPVAIGALSLLLIVPGLVRASTNPVAGAYHHCPAAGKGTNGPARDPDLNKLKNRASQTPADPYQVAELVDALAVPSDGALKHARHVWTADDRALVLTYEASEAQVTGYLFDAKAEGPEQPNCAAPVYHGDYHLWLLDNPDEDRTHAAVVEITPRWRNANPSWDITTLRQVAKDRTPVRITGWLLFDQEHPEQLGNTRGTLWELHPITKFEILENGTWTEL